MRDLVAIIGSIAALGGVLGMCSGLPGAAVADDSPRLATDITVEEHHL